MDPALSDLFSAWWLTGDPDATYALASILRLLPLEDAARALAEFRRVVQTGTLRGPAPSPDEDANFPP